MLDHKVVGPSPQFSNFFPVVAHVNQITNDSPFSLDYFRDTWHYPSRHEDLTDRWGATHVVHPKSKVPRFEGRQIEQVNAYELADGNKVD